MNLPAATVHTQIGQTKKKQRLGKMSLNHLWRASYHIEPETGASNDPNGLLYGKFQLFYQSWPFELLMV